MLKIASIVWGFEMSRVPFSSGRTRLDIGRYENLPTTGRS